MGRFQDALLKQAGEAELYSCETVIGGEKVTLYASAITAKDMANVGKRHKGFELGEITLDAQISTIILKAVDENGDKVFDTGDRPALARQTVPWINHIFTDLFGETFFAPDGEEDEGQTGKKS